MAIDRVYKKQLESFGIEFSPAASETPKKRQEFSIIQSDVIQGLMSTIQGRQWLWSKLDMCGVNSPPLVAGDPYGSHVLIGIQMVGQNLLNDIISNAAENYSLMLQEAAARQITKKDD